MNAYAEEENELKEGRTYTKQLCVVSYSKREEADLNKVVEN